jgi:beta-mannosidase
VAKEAAPDTFYWLASPSSGGSFDKPNDKNYGDVHDWSVWHGREPFTYYRSTYPRYLSEFGLQSFPSLKTVETFTLPEDRNIFSYVMENHQKCASGNEKIMYYISMYYKFPKDFEALLYLSQLIQAEGLKYGVEHWRRNRGRCMGVVFWQLNDCWPVASWASIDYYGRWKALHYTTKRFFAPVLVSACEEGTSVSLHVTNDSMKDVSGKLSWALCDAASTVVLSGEKTIESKALTAAEFERLDFANILDNESSMRQHYLEYRLENEKVISEGTVMFVPAKHFEFIEPLIEIKVEENGDEFILTLSSKAYAKSVEINFKEVDAVLSDNYFDLTANRIKKVIAKKAEMSRAVSLEELKMQLNMRSLINSY